MAKTITNEKIGVFIDTTPADTSATYNRLGEGINTFTPSNNGQVSTKHYINAKFASSKRTGLQKQWAISGDRAIGDACNDYLVSLSEKTGEDVVSSILIVELHNPTTTSTTTTYPAKKYACMIDISNDGTVEGGAEVTIDGTIYANGDPIEGTVVIGSDGTATFTATT